MELLIMTALGVTIGAPVCGMIIQKILSPKPCDGLAPVLAQILKNQERFMDSVKDCQYEMLETQRLILHYLEILERRQKPD